MSAGPPFQSRSAAWIVSGALALWGAFYIARTSFVIGGRRVFCLWDDGMISMTYARNLARGDGLLWNPGGEAIQGFSNPGVTLLMAAIHLLPIDSFTISAVVQLVTLACLLATALLVGALASRIGDAAWLAPVAIAAVAASASFCFWTLQGSDVGFVALWLVGSVFWFSTRGGAEGRWPAGLFALLAIGPLIRLDSLLFVGVFGLVALALPGDRVLRALRGGALVGAVVGAMLLASFAYYGDPLPNTFYLKATGAPLSVVLQSGLSQLGDLLPAALATLVLAGLGVWKHRDDPRVLLCGGLSLVAIVYHVQVGGDWAPDRGSRFIAVVLPLLALLSTVGAHSLLGERRTLVAASAILVALAANTSGVVSEWLDPREPTFLADRNLRNLESALYIRAHTDPDTTVAVTFAGVYPYFSERSAIDVWGKSDRHIAKQPVRLFFPGHSKWDWPYVIDERRPDLVTSAISPKAMLMRLKSFQRDYYRAVRDQRTWFFVRRDALSKVHDPELAYYDIATAEQQEVGTPQP